MIVLSDGFQNEGDAAGVANRLGETHGVVVHSIGVAGNQEAPNRPLLETIASVIDGERQYRYISDFRTLQTHTTRMATKFSTSVWFGSKAAQA